MEKKLLEQLLELISRLKPHEWERLKVFVDKKYSSKQRQVPMPSLEELMDYSIAFDFPNLRNQQSEYDKD